MKNLKNLQNFGTFISENYLDTSGNDTQLKGGEKVKKYNYLDKRESNPGDVTFGIVKRVQNNDVIVEFTDDRGQKSTATVTLEEFKKDYEIVS